jgi:hypothetical protein
MENQTLIKQNAFFITPNEKAFIIALYESISETLNFSTLEDVHDNLQDKTINSLKGIMGSLVKKGYLNEENDWKDDDPKQPTMDVTEKFHTDIDMDALAFEYGYTYDADDIDYEYLK